MGVLQAELVPEPPGSRNRPHLPLQEGKAMLFGDFRLSFFFFFFFNHQHDADDENSNDDLLILIFIRNLNETGCTFKGNLL